MKDNKRFTIWQKFFQASRNTVIEITGRRPSGGSMTLKVKVNSAWSGGDGIGAKLEDLDTGYLYTYTDGRIVARCSWLDVWMTSIQKLTVTEVTEF
jgi:hypothetical protein